MSDLTLLPIASALEDQLSSWFAQEARDLPWRRTTDPYAIWVSEIMLQQTQVDTVLPYYHRFLERFPTVEALASAPEDAVLKQWEGLGYYRRARLLHSGSKYVLEHHGGRLPETEEELKKIPGLGTYTVGALMAFAHEKRAAAVDGNTFRVLARLLAADWQIGRSKDMAQARELLWEIATDANSHVVNEALIELGATICRPKPRCEQCPLRSFCQAYQLDQVEEYPRAKARKASPRESWSFFILQDASGQVLVQQRPASGLLAGLWQFPAIMGNKDADAWRETLCAKGVQIEAPLDQVLQRQHVFSHRIWDMEVWSAKVKDLAPSLKAEESGGRLCWVSADELAQLTFSTALRDLRDRYIEEANSDE